MNKFLKLIAATAEPSAVIYCNRGDPSEFCTNDYIEMGNEVLAHYAQSGIPRGPRLKFSVESGAVRFVESGLRWVELFIMAHEVGHFINGDLSDAAKF